MPLSIFCDATIHTFIYRNTIFQFILLLAPHGLGNYYAALGICSLPLSRRHAYWLWRDHDSGGDPSYVKTTGNLFPQRLPGTEDDSRENFGFTLAWLVKPGVTTWPRRSRVRSVFDVEVGWQKRAQINRGVMVVGVRFYVAGTGGRAVDHAFQWWLPIVHAINQLISDRCELYGRMRSIKRWSARNGDLRGGIVSALKKKGEETVCLLDPCVFVKGAPSRRSFALEKISTIWHNGLRSGATM